MLSCDAKGATALRIYVDSAIHRWRGQLWCHVFSPDIEALHAFMSSIGSKREWFQDPSLSSSVSWPHYDANERRRAAAIAAGAIPVGRHQTVAMSRIVRNAWNDERVDPLERYRRTSSPRLTQIETWLIRELEHMGIAPARHLIGAT